MDFGWRRWANTVLATFVLTSAFWVLVGGWFYYRQLHAPAAVAASAPPAGPGPIVPVAGVTPAQLVDSFEYPRGGGTRRHHAIDIMAPEGTPVVAAAPGRIEKLFVSHDGGNTVYERSPDRATIYYYAHLADYAPGLGEGQAIARGAIIGHVGHSGDADAAAPHLHFEVIRTRADAGWSDPGTPVNPYSLLGGK